MAPISRRLNKAPRVSNVCVMNNTERVTTITIAPSTVPGTLLYQVPVNPNSAPRLQATASQFDSWYGNVSLEVETTGNAFSKDYVVVKHVPNGDPARLPASSSSLLNFAETSGRNGDVRKLQLDSNQSVSVSAPWSESYNPKKPINDPDPSDCNNGLFIIVANGSPGTDSVSLTVRLRYNIHFYGPIFTPLVTDSSISIDSTVGISNSNFFGSASVIVGSGVFVSGNNLLFAKPGRYLVAFSSVGTVFIITGSATPTGTATIFDFAYGITSAALASNGSFVIQTNLPNEGFSIATSAALHTSNAMAIAAYSL